MATASFNTLSPKMKANKSTSTFKSLKMASTVTETKQFRKKLLSLNNLYKNTLYTCKYALKHGHFNNLFIT